MGTPLLPLLIFVMWFVPAIYIMFDKGDVDRRAGWTLFALLTSPVALGLFLIFQPLLRAVRRTD